MNATSLVRAMPALLKTYGAAGLRQRTLFELRRAAGRLRAHPSVVSMHPTSAPVPTAWPFMVSAERVRGATPVDVALARAERVARGEHQAYRWTWCKRPIAAGDWSLHPVTGFAYDARAPWFRVPHFSDQAGDIKDVWEAARFGWAFDLARGWLVTGDDRYAERFWSAFESFRAGCPPFLGAHWSCGQETAIRAMAWLWMEGSIADAPASTPSRLAALRESLAWSGERIENALGYALSQRNNHGLSEAAGLIAIGARFGSADPRAARWLDLGRRQLDALVIDQFEPDGWYVQHSFTYLRLALDQLVTAARVLRWAGLDVSTSARGRIRASLRLLGAVVDPASGWAPNHGPNDGAYVLPLSTRGYRDMIPALTAACATFDEPLPAGVCADGETLAWLQASTTGTHDAHSRAAIQSGASGWVDARTSGARVFARAGRYRTRPAHIDSLHLDVWIGGRAVAVDAGTYRYAAAPPWNNGLASADVHNSLSIEAHPTTVRGPRFLWLRWPAARLLRARMKAGNSVRIDMINDSWAKAGITHRRSCTMSDGGVIVVDDVRTDRELREPICVHWLIDGAPDEVAVYAATPIERTDQRGVEGSVEGWIADGYATKRPATSVRVIARAVDGRFRLVTGFGDQRSAERLRAALDLHWST